MTGITTPPTVATTTDWTMDADEIVDAAFNRCGGEKLSGYERARSALRALNLMLRSWEVRGLALGSIEETTLTLVPGQAAYALPADTVDVLAEMFVRTTNGTWTTDLPMSRIGRSQYVQLPNKSGAPGRPMMAWVDRQNAAPVATLWPVPDASQTYVVHYWRKRRYKDVPSLVYGLDVGSRYLPAIVAGLAGFLAQERPEVSEEKLARLLAAADREFALVAQEDVDNSDITVSPDLSSYFRGT